MNKLGLTFDVDWVNDEILFETVRILTEHKIKATFFATHDSELLRSLDPGQFEIGLHPNFETDLGRYDLNKLAELKAIYPNAIGMRSHTLFFSSRLLPELERLNLKYESNVFLFRHPNLMVVDRTETIKSIPFNWSDDKHIELCLSHDLNSFPNFKSLGINVINFHPIHIFLNTKNQLHYENSRSLFNKSSIQNAINNDFGVKNIFLDLVEYIKMQGIQTNRMIDFLGRS